MPPLKNVGYERMVQHYLRDPSSQARSYLAAGYKPSRHVDSSAARAFRRPDVKARLAELQGQIAQRVVATGADIVEEIDKLALSDAGELFDLDADVLRLLPMKEWTDRARAAVAGIEVKQYPVGERLPPLSSEQLQKWEDVVMGRSTDWDISRALPTHIQQEMLGIIKALRGVDWEHEQVTKIKLWDKNKALNMAGLHRGLFSDEKTGIDHSPKIVEVTRVMDREAWLAAFNPTAHVGGPAEGKPGIARIASATGVDGQVVTRPREEALPGQTKLRGDR